MIDQDDRDLRGAFEALRREAAAHTPPFDTTGGAARRRLVPGARRRTLVLATAAVLAGVALVLVLTPHRPGVQLGLASVRWESPTDFLLRLPGDELLRVVPRLDFTPSTINWSIP